MFKLQVCNSKLLISERNPDESATGKDACVGHNLGVQMFVCDVSCQSVKFRCTSDSSPGSHIICFDLLATSNTLEL
jgi:hypothetical protein